MSIENDSVNTQSDDVDALISTIETPEENTPIQDAKPAAPIQEYSFKYEGKEIKAPIEKLIKWAEMGYGAPNRIGELNKQLEGFKTQETKWKELETKYGPVDDYAKKNPQWFQHILSQYEQAQKGAAAQADPKLTALEQELADLKKFKDEFTQTKQAEQVKQEDSAYMAELESIKKQYPKIDLTTPDESGKSREYKVLEYAQQNGIKKFTTAFRDLFHDEILSLKSEEAKESAAKQKQAQAKLGILDVSSAPTKKPMSSNSKGKSWNDLANEAISELGLTS